MLEQEKSLVGAINVPETKDNQDKVSDMDKLLDGEVENENEFLPNLFNE